MTVECPICKGNGFALPKDKYNQVQYGDNAVEELCWMCGGEGRVLQEPVKNKMTIHKYWNYKEVEDGNQG